jgi:hypothetical protein
VQLVTALDSSLGVTVIVPPHGEKSEKDVARVRAALAGHLVEEVVTGLQARKAGLEVRREFPDATGNGPKFRGNALLALTPTQVVLFGSKQRRPFLRAITLLGMWPRDSIQVRSIIVDVAPNTPGGRDMFAVRLRATDESIDIVLEAPVMKHTAAVLETLVRATGGEPGDDVEA